MTCPPDIARVILGLIQIAVLRTRARGSAGDASRCASEADHVHHLPALLLDYSDDLLRFYWQVERPSFIQRRPAADLLGYVPLRAELAVMVEARVGSGPSSAEASSAVLLAS